MPRNRSHTRRTARANPRGVLVARAGGFGFVQTAEGEYFVPAADMNGAFDGDLVELAPMGSAKGARKGSRALPEGVASAASEKPAARVLRVVERAHDSVVGRYEVAEPFGVVVPCDTRISYDIFTMRADYPDIPDGALVRVRIAQFPTRRTAATGVIEEVLGMAADAAVGVDLIVARHKLETAFSAAAQEEALAATLDEEGALSDGYRDLRRRFVLTVDPADARDFDDAVSLERVSSDAFGGGAWRLGVHIADVSHYVPWNSSLDLEARRRATSVYLVDRVIPMLPHELSNELCSLKPGEVRRTMTVDVWLDDAAKVLRYEIYPALIRSSARLSYEEAQSFLEAYAATSEDAFAMPRCAVQDPAGPSGASLPHAFMERPSGAEECGVRRLAQASSEVAGSRSFDGASADAGSAVASTLAGLSRIAKLRAAARCKAGGLDFDVPEAKVRLDEEGEPLAIELRKKTDATSLIEEAMILANEVVATHLSQHAFPCIYRVHETPSLEALGALIPVFQEFHWFTQEDADGLAVGDPRTIQRIMAASEGRSEAQLVSSLLLRSMKRALYRPENGGHYGLASRAYAHFTSPIRRYPDLVVHRMLKALASKRPEKFDQEVAALPWISEHSSDMERIADTAARESQELKMVEYLQQFVGSSFSAVVSGVAAYGLYVRLENTAEGLLPIRALGNEYWSFDSTRYLLMGMESGKTYRLGQRIAVTLTSAEPASGKLEFRLASGKEARFPSV
ncbi:MAG: RNB domain-containing ribonuclease [Eggerthellaceae bacterium]|nr:RNB domain-containing ribonuclease [Eggerthellaceae bacterium]